MRFVIKKYVKTKWQTSRWRNNLFLMIPKINLMCAIKLFLRQIYTFKNLTDFFKFPRKLIIVTLDMFSK